MKNTKNTEILAVFAMASLFALSCFALPAATAAPAAMQADEFQPNPAAGTGDVIVTPKFGGEILGYDIDRNGTEGLLSEFVTLSSGESLVATETFNQKTGAILKVVAKENNTLDDYDTQGVFGPIGLVLFQHAGQNHLFQNHFLTINHSMAASSPANGRLQLRRTTSFGQSARTRELQTWRLTNRLA